MEVLAFFYLQDLAAGNMMLAAVYACQVTLMNRNLPADSYSSSHLLQLKLRPLW